MRKGIFLSLLVATVLTSCVKGLGSRKFDERITLRQKDKIPYGTAAAWTLLPSLFPNAAISREATRPGEWEAVATSYHDQAVILTALEFDADDTEVSRLIQFARQGNFVFITASAFSESVQRAFGVSATDDLQQKFFYTVTDSLSVRLSPPAFRGDRVYAYPGRGFDASFGIPDPIYVQQLGSNDDGNPNFIRLRTGKGAIFLHSEPLAFSNYFILHKNNIRYFESAMSLIPKTVERVVWNEYYLVKPTQQKPKERSAFRVLMQYPAFKWGLLTALLMLLLFVLFNTRRRQRMIPPYTRPVNDSLDFVKTLGRLYFDKSDHLNLSRKMAVYFLEHVRSVYQLPTHTLDEAFVQTLHYKSGYPLKELEKLTGFIRAIDSMPAVSEAQLSDFHRELELFYQNT